MTSVPKPRLIAFYLPQYHPIPENDSWWGKGFTEWTNVAKAKPLFKGHHQPHLPADLGYYDLRVPEARQAQAELAREYGIHGFCYYHYWFNGKQLLERPFKEVLESGRPDFPFCLCWANESWTGIWHAAPDRVLIQQTYPGNQDYINHFDAVLPALRDPRYITIENKPVFVVYNPHELPNPKDFTLLWNDLARNNGLRGIYFLGLDQVGNWDYKNDGFDGAIVNDVAVVLERFRNRHKEIRGWAKRVNKQLLKKIYDAIKVKPQRFTYNEFVKESLLAHQDLTDRQFPSVIPNWDNTPRSNRNGIVVTGSTPTLFKEYFSKVFNTICSRDNEQQIIFLKSWNEWAEGNYLEPDQRFGRGYLDVLKEVATAEKSGISS